MNFSPIKQWEAQVQVQRRGHSQCGRAVQPAWHTRQDKPVRPPHLCSPTRASRSLHIRWETARERQESSLTPRHQNKKSAPSGGNRKGRGVGVTSAEVGHENVKGLNGRGATAVSTQKRTPTALWAARALRFSPAPPTGVGGISGGDYRRLARANSPTRSTPVRTIRVSPALTEPLSSSSTTR